MRCFICCKVWYIVKLILLNVLLILNCEHSYVCVLVLEQVLVHLSGNASSHQHYSTAARGCCSPYLSCREGRR
jgi:hypothetical protein